MFTVHRRMFSWLTRRGGLRAHLAQGFDGVGGFGEWSRVEFPCFADLLQEGKSAVRREIWIDSIDGIREGFFERNQLHSFASPFAQNSVEAQGIERAEMNQQNLVHVSIEQFSCHFDGMAQVAIRSFVYVGTKPLDRFLIVVDSTSRVSVRPS